MPLVKGEKQLQHNIFRNSSVVRSLEGDLESRQMFKIQKALLVTISYWVNVLRVKLVYTLS